jgi:hypothetical protein
VFRVIVSQPKRLERRATAGESPVGEGGKGPIRYLSRARHVEAGSNPRGPSRKAKYSLAIDGCFGRTCGRTATKVI